MTVKGRSPRPGPKIARNHNSHPASHSRIPDPALHEGFVRQPDLCMPTRAPERPVAAMRAASGDGGRAEPERLRQLPQRSAPVVR